jgi:CheY-like chemotaxis protein
MASTSALAGLELLVISDDYSTLKTFVCARRETGRRIDSTASIECARDLLQNRRMHGIVVDMGLSGACEFIQEARNSEGNEAPIFIACAGTPQEERAALSAGANFVVHKPVSTSKVFDLLSLSGTMPTPQRRACARHRLIAPVTIFCGGLQFRALTSDLSQGGMSVRTARLSGTDTLVEFFLEVRSTAVAGRGRIMWNGENGCAGVKFESVRCSNPAPFPEWLEKQGSLLREAAVSF